MVQPKALKFVACLGGRNTKGNSSQPCGDCAELHGRKAIKLRLISHGEPNLSGADPAGEARQ